jgi:hypothetical protein
MVRGRLHATHCLFFSVQELRPMNVAFCFQVGKLEYEEAGIPALFIPGVVV